MSNKYKTDIYDLLELLNNKKKNYNSKIIFSMFHTNDNSEIVLSAVLKYYDNLENKTVNLLNDVFLTDNLAKKMIDTLNSKK